MRNDSGPRPLVPTVLVVEDDLVVAESVGEIVREAGYHPVIVTTLTEARDAIEDDQPSLVVLDLTLHAEFGADLLDELADREDAPAVLILSAFQLASMIGHRFGVPVVTKPFGVEGLISAMHAAVAVPNRPRRIGS